MPEIPNRTTMWLSRNPGALPVNLSKNKPIWNVKEKKWIADGMSHIDFFFDVQISEDDEPFEVEIIDDALGKWWLSMDKSSGVPMIGKSQPYIDRDFGVWNYLRCYYVAVPAIPDDIVDWDNSPKRITFRIKQDGE